MTDKNAQRGQLASVAPRATEAARRERERAMAASEAVQGNNLDATKKKLPRAVHATAAQTPEPLQERREDGLVPSQDSGPPNLSTRPMTPVDAASYLGLDVKTVTRWARQGYLPAHPLGEGKRKFWRFLEPELVAWLATKSNVSESA